MLSMYVKFSNTPDTSVLQFIYAFPLQDNGIGYSNHRLEKSHILAFGLEVSIIWTFSPEASSYYSSIYPW